MPPRTRPNAQDPWPSQEEIAACTAAIRASWSPHQRRVRAGLSPEINAVEIAVVTAGTLEGRRDSIDFD